MTAFDDAMDGIPESRPVTAPAFARAVALADEAGAIPTWSTPPDDVHERDWRAGYAAAMADFADRLGHILASAGENR